MKLKLALAASTLGLVALTGCTSTSTDPAPVDEYYDSADTYSQEQLKAALAVNAYWDGLLNTEQLGLCREYVVSKSTFKRDFLTGYGYADNPEIWWAAAVAMLDVKCR